MTDYLHTIGKWSVASLEFIGIVLIVSLALYALFFTAKQLLTGHEEKTRLFKSLRQLLGKGILLGLEFFVAADIVHTVTIDLSFRSVGILAIIILIRTFLSFTLEVELTGEWPWQQKNPESKSL